MLSVSTQIRLNRPVNLRTDFLREEAKQICSDESRYRGYNGGDGVRVIGQEFRQKKLRVKGFEDLKLGGGDKSVAEHSHGVMTIRRAGRPVFSWLFLVLLSPLLVDSSVPWWMLYFLALASRISSSGASLCL
ncbi:hypothetical protein AtNW77_Chr5g0113611 [Arabidopsis thaliana]|uniref:Transmembrane protein n=1 Tax=Arabidopsis thaliana x Arabidopsis arenosa TaxID=1240361 RepID=A0A8T2D180_9BRAS|nr:hypothetical protein ISN45_At05g026990 [Arabidopsis thaliana x Arabidopsis arenosa]